MGVWEEFIMFLCGLVSDYFARFTLLVITFSLYHFKSCWELRNRHAVPCFKVKINVLQYWCQIQSPPIHDNAVIYSKSDNHCSNPFSNILVE